MATHGKDEWIAQEAYLTGINNPNNTHEQNMAVATYKWEYNRAHPIKYSEWATADS